MGKGRIFGKLAVVAVVALALSSVSCGTANDQGISFRIVGWSSDGMAADETGKVVPLSCTHSVLSFVGLENNLVQGIQVERIDFDYVVPAGQLSIPSDSHFLGFRLGPSSGQEPSNPPRTFSEVFVAGAQLLEFLNSNRDRLPPLPFRLVATARAVGITDAGDVFTTNPGRYLIEFLDDESCAPDGSESIDEEAIGGEGSGSSEG